MKIAPEELLRVANEFFPDIIPDTDSQVIRLRQAFNPVIFAVAKAIDDEDMRNEALEMLLDVYMIARLQLKPEK